MILPGRVALLIVIFFSATSAWAQSLGTLKGLVTDSKTGEPLPNVGITLIGTYIASVSDYDGNYIISKIPVGDFSVKVQFIGYGTQIINGVRLKKGEIKLLDIKISSSRQNILGKKIDFLACDCEVICRFAFAGHSTSEPHQPLAPPPSHYQAKHGVLLLSVRPALLAVHSCCGNCYLHRCIGICQSESG